MKRTNGILEQEDFGAAPVHCTCAQLAIGPSVRRMSLSSYNDVAFTTSLDIQCVLFRTKYLSPHSDRELSCLFHTPPPSLPDPIGAPDAVIRGLHLASSVDLVARESATLTPCRFWQLSILTNSISKLPYFGLLPKKGCELIPSGLQPSVAFDLPK